MINYLFAGDFHIKERDIAEIEAIFAELLIIIKEAQITKFFITGDTFDSISPTSSELDCFSKFIKSISIPVILIVANSHESTTNENSVVNHFGILRDNITCYKTYEEGNILFVGHFGVKESKLNYGGTIDKKTLSKYRHVVLGHFHNHEIINPNICQLGSVRYVDFSEDTSISKKVAVCYNVNDKRQQWRFFTLESYAPMINVVLEKTPEYSGAIDAEIVQTRASGEKIDASYKYISDLLAFLDKLNEKTKVRIIFKDYHSWREFLPFSTQYKNKFVLYKEKKSFILDLASGSSKTETSSLKESLETYIIANKVPQQIADILMKEIK